MNALSVVTYGVDKRSGTDYNKRFLKYLEYFQKNDIAANCAQTDVKGDRSKRPHEQKDPDLYLRVVERRRDGIVVRGAKAHNTIAGYAEEIIVTPTRFLTPEEKDWAVAFAIPADWDNVHLVCRVTNPRERKNLDAPIAHMGDVESLTIFDDTFIPGAGAVDAVTQRNVKFQAARPRHPRRPLLAHVAAAGAGLGLAFDAPGAAHGSPVVLVFGGTEQAHLVVIAVGSAAGPGELVGAAPKHEHVHEFLRHGGYFRVS
jgi:hypothetical protein